jgi:hypothetical protein
MKIPRYTALKALRIVESEWMRNGKDLDDVCFSSDVRRLETSLVKWQEAVKKLQEIKRDYEERELRMAQENDRMRLNLERSRNALEDLAEEPTSLKKLQQAEDILSANGKDQP